VNAPDSRPGTVSARNESSGRLAVGDVRGGNVKRVASAVGEGSIAVALVRQVLQQEVRLLQNTPEDVTIGLLLAAHVEARL
jgi:hypothetical protein